MTSFSAAVPGPQAKTSGPAIASLVLGILGFFTVSLTAIPAIIFGVVALMKIGKSAGRLKGNGLAVAGICVSVASIIIFLAVLAALVVTKVASKIDQARVTTTIANMRNLHVAVNQFKMDTGRFPVEEEGLRALIEQPADVTGWELGGYLETTDIPKDGWNRDFIYGLNLEGGKPFVIKSLGADGEEGGEGYDADLLSTDADSPREERTTEQ